ncbi:MAG: YdcF family protein [Candidatus Rokubacteria bacterium]|nr:YdcF family protein [Candidatus Rokubacteria bacterium]
MRGVRPLGLVALLLFAAAAFTPLASWLNAWMAGVARLEPADAIVVLGRGGADTDGVLTNRSLRRVLHGVALHQQALAPWLVLSGSAEEIQARATLAQGLGVPAAAILRAGLAHTTREEADRLGRLLLPRGSRRILLVADPIDMPRARGAMERAGFTVLPAPTAASGPSQPEARLGLLRDIVIELAGWTYYRLTGTL